MISSLSFRLSFMFSLSLSQFCQCPSDLVFFLLSLWLREGWRGASVESLQHFRGFLRRRPTHPSFCCKQEGSMKQKTCDPHPLALTCPKYNSYCRSFVLSMLFCLFSRGSARFGSFPLFVGSPSYLGTWGLAKIAKTHANMDDGSWRDEKRALSCRASCHLFKGCSAKRRERGNKKEESNKKTEKIDRETTLR